MQVKQGSEVFADNSRFALSPWPRPSRPVQNAAWGASAGDVFLENLDDFRYDLNRSSYLGSGQHAGNHQGAGSETPSNSTQGFDVVSIVTEKLSCPMNEVSSATTPLD